MRGTRPLSRQEQEVLKNINKMDKEIAGEMNISENTVKGYQKSIRLKLGVGTKVEMAIWAVKFGLL